MEPCIVTGDVRNLNAKGFTLLEMVMVLLLIALLASLVAPTYMRPIDQAKEATLKDDLIIIRKAIDDYFADNGRYPDTLERLVEKRYLRNIPKDPISESSETWVLIWNDSDPTRPGIIDIRSGATSMDDKGSGYADW
jgi:general secretion pathway protein G